MRTGEIWGHIDPKTGKKTGFKVTHRWDSIGECERHIAWAYSIKTGAYFCFVLTADGTPMLKDGNASPDWKLIEEAK